LLSSFNNLFAQRLLDLSLDLNISQQVRAGTNGAPIEPMSWWGWTADHLGRRWSMIIPVALAVPIFTCA
jgi:hypothetical protein